MKYESRDRLFNEFKFGTLELLVMLIINFNTE
jgi:hypothetical protein